MIETAQTPWVSGECACGETVGQYLSHYQILRCSCGRWHWALRPRRGGPLLLFPWPGPWPILRERTPAVIG
jgi:hypothetical protein